jgi:hypothetical protein
LPIDETVASLSAILLDADYYALLKENLRDLTGLPLLHEAAVIPFKAKAYLDLSRRKTEGEATDSRDVRKHRNDVFRIPQLLPAEGALELPASIQADMRAFVEAVAGDETFKPADLGLAQTREVALARLVAAYHL